MGYYTKHIVKVKENHTLEELTKVMETVTKYTGYNFTFLAEHKCFDDRNWNSGCGCKFYNSEDILKKVTEEIPDIAFDVYCHGEGGEEYIYHCSNGKLTTEELTKYVFDEHYGGWLEEPINPDREEIDYIKE